jgi:uncharacterized protein YecE (DUF72 family)
MIFIGTSGYYYHHWIGNFYPADLPVSKWLKYYSEFFNSVELNVSFYRLPSEKAFISWNQKVPLAFMYAVKGSRFITHSKKLNDVEDPVKIFFQRAKLLKNKLGIVLWQFPSNLHFDKLKLENFLRLLQKYHEKNAFEFRHESWFNNECYKLLKSYGAALVISDSPNYPKHEILTADYTYVRFHGGKILYGSEYSKMELDQWAEKIEKWKNVKNTYIYFNNDAYGFAVKNGQYLKEKLTII